jgi:hypothetical protein
MTRILVLGLIAAVLSVAHPDVREYLKPHVEQVLNPVYVWSANSRVTDFHRRLEADMERGRQVPSDSALHVYLERAFPGVDLTDPWGTPYFLANEHNSVRVASAGPDRARGTADDILSPPIRANTR